MPTKLKKPITVTLYHVENAIFATLKIINEWETANPRHQNIREAMVKGELGAQLKSSLADQGIDWRTWEPPQPFKIGAHETTFNPNGSINVGCTEIDRDTLLEVLKRSEQAMGKVEAEWPKYYLEADGDLFRVNSETHFGTYLRKLEDIESTIRPLGMDWVKEKKMKQIPRAEACAILGREV